MSKKEPIALGATAELYDFGAGVVLKLYLAGDKMSEAHREAERARLAHTAGAPTPAVIGVEQIDGRAGVLFERVQGPTMVQQMLSGAGDPLALAQTLAELHVRLHQLTVSEGPSQPQRMRDALNRAALSAAERTQMQDLLQQLLQNGGAKALCHGDFHPSNIIMGQDGPMIIDWVDLTLGEPTADVARTLLLLEHGALPVELPPEEARQISALRKRFAQAYLARYGELNALDGERLREASRLAAAVRLAENIRAEEAVTLRRLMAGEDLDQAH